MIWLGADYSLVGYNVRLYQREWEGDRGGEGAIESGIVSLSSCQEQWCIVLLCLAEVCVSSWVEIQNESSAIKERRCGY